MKVLNHQVRLAARPAPGLPKASDWAFTEEEAGDPPPHAALVKVLYCSLDPAMRTWMNAGRSYVPPVEIGEVMRAAGIGRVVASSTLEFREGEFVTGTLGIQEYATLPASDLTKIDAAPELLPVYLGALGYSGMTAYFGLLDVGRAQAGETVVVSAAAGSVGSVAGQIAKAIGARVVGIAGGADKCRYLIETLGFDEAIDYKSADLNAALRAACPKGMNVYFDNVGGATLNAALRNLARHARIVLCGAVSQYNATEPGPGPTNYMNLLVSRASMTGFVIFDYESRFPEARERIAGWIAAGRLKPETHLVRGLQQFPAALNALFAGENVGKFVLEVAKA
jgi:NADPH-dependent curcumin reductase CurA